MLHTRVSEPLAAVPSRSTTMQRALFWLLIAALLPLAIGAGIVLWQQVGRDREANEARLLGATAAIAFAVERELAAGFAELGVLTHSPLIDEGQWGSLHQLFAKVVATRPGAHLGLIDPDGNLRVSTAMAPQGAMTNLWVLEGRTTEWQGRHLPLGSQRLTQRVYDTGLSAVSGLFFGTNVKRPAIGLAAPVWRGDRVAYALLLSFHPENFARALDLPHLEDEVAVTLIDTEGRVILASGATPLQVGDMVEPGMQVSSAGAEGKVQRATDASGTPLLVSQSTSRLTGWRTIASEPQGNAFAAAIASAQTWTALFLVAVLGGGLLASVLSRRITAPFAQLAAATSAALRGEPPQLPKSRFVEIDALGDALVGAAERDRRHREESEARSRAEQGETLALHAAQIARMAELRLRNLIDNLYAFVGILDLEGRVVEINRAPLERAGLSRADVLGRPFHECWWWQHEPAIAQRVHGAVAAALAGDSVRFDIESRMAAGRIVTIDLQILPLFDDAGRIVQLIPSGVDVTDRVEAVRAMRESESRFRALADNMSQLAWIADAGGRAFWFNRRWYEYTGLDSEAPDEDRWRHAVHPDHAVELRSSFDASAARGETWEAMFPLRGADGGYRWFLARAVPIRDAEGRISRWFGTNTDITEQREVEEALRTSEQRLLENQDRLREADRQKDQFIATLAHELRNPLAPILTSAEIIGMQAGPSGEIAQAQQTILRQAQHMSRLVDDLLDVSRIKHGRFTLQRECVDLGDVLATALEAIAPVLEAAGQVLETDFDPPPLPVDADPMRLCQALLNVLHNAVKFSPRGATLRIGCRRENGRVRLWVADEGIGIGPEMRERVFDIFVQERRSGIGGHSGLGIGLALSRSLLEMHGGSIAVDSAGHDAGSTFTIDLPLGRSLPAAAPPPPLARGGCARRVLIVDDNVDAAEALATMLSLLGHDTQVAHDGGSALRMHALHQPEVTVLDIGLPDMSGYEVARELRRLHGDRCGALVALTGWGQESDKQQAREAGFGWHFTKPAHPSEIIAVLAELD